MKHFSKPIFGADAFLNPNVIYPLQNSDDDDKQVLAVSYKTEFQRCMMKMIDSPEKQMTIIKKTNNYKDKIEYFGMSLTIFSCLTMDPSMKNCNCNFVGRRH